jgi:hypothetical protein
MEAGLYVVLLVVVQRHVRGWRAQAALFLVLVIFLFDVLLGTSWNGFRRMMPVFALLIVAREPFTAARVASAGVFVGLGAAYSHEFGALALLSVIAIYGLELLQSVTWRRLATPIVLTTIAAVTWYVTCRLVLGPVMPAYLENAVRGASRFASEASFAFFWTVNSLATFAFLAVAVVVVGSGLGRWCRTRRSGTSTSGRASSRRPTLRTTFCCRTPWGTRFAATSMRIRMPWSSSVRMSTPVCSPRRTEKTSRSGACSSRP